jgi:hypothetical protein
MHDFQDVFYYYAHHNDYSSLNLDIKEYRDMTPESQNCGARKASQRCYWLVTNSWQYLHSLRSFCKVYAHWKVL